MKNHALLLLGLTGTMWALEILDLLPFAHLDRFGIQPRSLSGLLGIVCAPFLHAGFGHLLANTLPFLVLGGIVLLGGSRIFWGVTLLVTLMGGLAVWLFAPKFTNHIGASGVIFGYLGFLMARGFFEGSVRWILIACAIFVLYGGLLVRRAPARRGRLLAGTSLWLPRRNNRGAAPVLRRYEVAPLIATSPSASRAEAESRFSRQMSADQAANDEESEGARANTGVSRSKSERIAGTALRAGIAEVDTPDKAERTIDTLERAGAALSEVDAQAKTRHLNLKARAHSIAAAEAHASSEEKTRGCIGGNRRADRRRRR